MFSIYFHNSLNILQCFHNILLRESTYICQHNVAIEGGFTEVQKYKIFNIFTIFSISYNVFTVFYQSRFAMEDDYTVVQKYNNTVAK